MEDTVGLAQGAPARGRDAGSPRGQAADRRVHLRRGGDPRTLDKPTDEPSDKPGGRHAGRWLATPPIRIGVSR